VGDAALRFDPLSAQGVLSALYTGILGAKAILSERAGADALPSYARALHHLYEAFLTNQTMYYQQEQRWPSAPFWQARLNTDSAVINHLQS
jgi:flavin-dependent dehydrogenase